MVNQLADRLKEQEEAGGKDGQLRAEVAAQELGFSPSEIPAKLLGRSIDRGEWWQYLKELAYQHPASVLFLTRQVISKDQEVLLPRFYRDAPLGQKLGLVTP
jgi:hypothetical protein